MKKIKDILQRDPATHPLVNQGQARITDRADERVLRELEGELATFVCEGQFADGMQRIIESFLRSLGQTNQRATWVSGFFGSGKSHLLKMLCHLWQDTKFSNGQTARSLVPSMPEELHNLLRELDTAGKRSGGLLAAAGTLPSGTTETVRLTVLSVILRAVGLPDQYAQAQFCLWLCDQDYFNTAKAGVEAAGKEWEKELNNLYVSGPIAKALLTCDPDFAANEMEVRKTLRETFPQRTTDITTPEFLTITKRALKLKGENGRHPCTLLVLDEVQQYIGDSNDRSTLVTEVVEAISKQLDSHVIVVAAGQSALTEVPLLHKLMDRFTIRISLSDADVETVTRKVLLQKKPTEIVEVRALLDEHAGEISRQLQGTRIGESVADRNTIVDDYPLTPVRRRFWENCFRQVDAAGTQSQLRSQLRIIHDAVAALSDRRLGALVPADELFDALAPEMVNTGVLLRELNERIINLSSDGSPESRLARRICGTVFLISKLPTEAGADIGVRATKEHIADLLVEDLKADNGKLRADVEKVLEKLATDGTLMQLGDEYRLQTKEGAEWDREFRNRQTKLANDEAIIQLRRDALLYAEANEVVRSVKLLHGAAKEPRHLSVYRDQTPPPESGETISIWIRDGWSGAEKDVTGAARSAGGDKPTIFVFIPRQSADDLKRLVVEADAAQQTLDAKGSPNTPEGVEARRSLESRRDLAVQNRDSLIKEIVGNTKVFQGGGSELLQASLAERIREAANASLVRLFPRFKEADSSKWEAVIKRAREGADQPFEPVGHSAATEQHPVCQQVLVTIGAGKMGTEVRKALQTSPFGWPKDAIDAALIALHRLQHLSAMLNGTPLASGQLDQNKIPKSEFRIERATLSVQDRLALRGVFQKLGVSCKGGEETAKAPEFLSKLLSLASSAGGTPPLPAQPDATDIQDIQRLVGNEQLAAIRAKQSDFEARIEEWTKAARTADDRKPKWDLVERLAHHAADSSEASEHLEQVEAIRSGRMLLEPTDPVTPLRAELSRILRKAVKEAEGAHRRAYDEVMDMLAGNPVWTQVSESDHERILADVGLDAPVEDNLTADDALVASLDARALAARRSEVDAVAGRAQRAVELAAKLLEPKVRPLTLERTTLRSEEDVRGWLSRQERKLLEAVKSGPVLVN
jgi:hypothetical protein